MTVYAYLRTSTDKQTYSLDNQKFELLNFASDKKRLIHERVEETISGTRSAEERKLGKILEQLKEGDVLIVSELSRLGRNLLEVMSILHTCMSRHIQVFTVKEKYELGNNLSSKILAFAFSLAGEVERQLISQRTIQGLQARKAAGMILGRPKGSLNEHTKLSSKEADIQQLLQKKLSYASIGRLFDVHRNTVRKFVETRKLG